MNLACWKQVKLNHVAHKVCEWCFLPKSYNVKLPSLFNMCGDWLFNLDNHAWFPMVSSQVWKCAPGSDVYYHTRQQGWGWMCQRCRDDRKWAMRDCCLLVESQCTIPDEMIWSQMGTQLHTAFQLLGKTLRLLPWNQQSRRSSIIL